MKNVILVFITVFGLIACALLAETAFQTGNGKLYFFAAACMLISLVCALLCGRRQLK